MNGLTVEEQPFLRLFMRLKWRLADNYIRHLHRFMWFHLIVALCSMGVIVIGGTLSFRYAFGFLLHDSDMLVFGPLLMDHLIKMVLLAFFSMLIFSNLVIMLTTTYLSREVEYLMSQPVSHRRLFFGKLIESIFYSSWAFVVLALPMFAALGAAQKLSWMFYPAAAVMVVPYLIIPAVMGACVVLVITVFCPPRHLIRFALAMAAIGILGALLAQRTYGSHAMIWLGGSTDTDQLGQLMQVMRLGDLMVLPSGWLGRGLTSLRLGDWSEAGFWALALWSTAGMGLVVCDWIAGPLYFRGWCNARSSGTTARKRRLGFFGCFRWVLMPLNSPTRALVAKDLAVFWRDPAQWGQLMILFGLLFIYITNLRSASSLGTLETAFPFWESLVSLFNIGATTFVLSILTTRFVYPMLSLEGKQQWVIGLAPIPRTRLVWVKFLVSWICSVMLTVPLSILSSVMLQTDWPVTLMSIVTVLTMSGGLSALAVGFGALMPNFNDDNPARIASGLGGTINAMASLIYIGLTLGLEAPWIHAQINGIPQHGVMQTIFWGSIPAWVVLQFVMIIAPIGMGLRRWKRIEF